ncbi:uncharacterized protein LOC124394164 [Silurus meridionalis]|uniref:Uncharacterized protein n=1 Tax=Silurus meridionalis TaxID=175797 RepID=A0A8T0B648_SILME|nr:uncharacterized protein LOC124394164 [Silurus meridionalis]KAF7699816.1 hypothetical protein HF521_002774 [Silurus meridionalis]
MQDSNTNKNAGIKNQLQALKGLSLPLVTEKQRNDILPDFLPPNEIHIEEFEDGDDHSQDQAHRYSSGMENLYRGTKRRRSIKQITEEAPPRKKQCEENEDYVYDIVDLTFLENSSSPLSGLYPLREMIPSVDVSTSTVDINEEDSDEEAPPRRQCMGEEDNVYEVVDLTFSERSSSPLSGSSPFWDFIPTEDASSSTEDFWLAMMRTMEQSDVEDDHEEVPSGRSQCVEEEDDVCEVDYLTFSERSSCPFWDFIPTEDASFSTEDFWLAMMRTMEQSNVEDDNDEAPSRRNQCVEKHRELIAII